MLCSTKTRRVGIECLQFNEMLGLDAGCFYLTPDIRQMDWSLEGSGSFSVFPLLIHCNTFHTSNLKKCLADPTLQVPLDEIQVDTRLNFVEEHVEILEREFKKLKRSRIAIVKVRWKLKRGPEFTCEREDQMKLTTSLEIMPPRMRTQSVGRPVAESRGGGTGERVGRGGRGRGPRGEGFCPSHEMQKLETELWNHVMVGAGHAAYTNRFHELARLVTHLVTPESTKIERYVYGLTPQIRRMVAAMEPKTM
ncbi:hypothetical protein Tco_0702350 [Tanacetum coccineum]|uniref:Reverse transcriptase domain-containing protein n=1 Tax=Tanacetum coccineum TaxID=301880 RepID=A0ABQ4XW25_9ASTR